MVYNKGKLPKAWKKGNIIPIPKESNNILKLDRFRPKCLLSNVAKIMDKIMNKRIMKMALKYDWIPKTQSGFVKKRSTLDNLIILQQEIHG